HLDAFVQGHLDFGGGGHAGEYRHPDLPAAAHHLGAETGGDDIGGPVGHGPVHLVGTEHGARAERDVFVFGDGADGVFGGIGAEGDLGHRQAAGFEGLGHGPGVFGAVDHGHGHDTVPRELIHYRHIRAPRFVSGYRPRSQPR